MFPNSSYAPIQKIDIFAGRFMEHSIISFGLLSILSIIVFLLLKKLGFFKSKGDLGELAVSSYLSVLDEIEYLIINDLVVENRGITTQIDHIVISEYGIFVIETKNYKGWIYGSDNGEYWTQVLYKRKNKFFNPILQNSGHINTLRQCLREFGNLPFINIVTFSPEAELKNSFRSNAHVISFRIILQTILSYRISNISESKKQDIYKKLFSLNKSATYNKRKHISEIKNRVSERERARKSGLCPRCGGKLVVREGKNGEFIGCSSFPRCTYSDNINGW